MVDNDALLIAGLELMRQNGKSAKKITGTGRSMRYTLTSGETVRVRTCNDHVLIVLSNKHSGSDAKLNIEGTDWLLVVMPEVERTPGEIRAYLVPTSIAVEAAKQCHHQWLNSNPSTRGDNRTWNLWFRGSENNFDKIWRRYRLSGHAKTHQAVNSVALSDDPVNVKTEVELARQRISEAAGVPLEAVRITIDFAL